MTPQQLLRQAVALHRIGRLAEAERDYLQVLQADAASFTAHHLLGVLRFQQGRNAEALELIGAALQAKPDAVEARMNHGLVLHAAGRFDEALMSYDKALAVKPDYPELLNNRGVTLWDLGRFEDALASFDRALDIKPDYIEALYNRGNSLRAMKRFDEALASYDTVLAIAPGYIVALYNRGITLWDMKRAEEALSSFDEALAIKPDYAAALNNRGNTLRKLKRFDEAVKSFDRALALNPDYAEAWNNRGNALHDLKRFDEALASFDRALALNPSHAEAWYNLGNILRDLKRFDEALASYDRSIAINPDFSEALQGRGMLQWTEFKRREAAVRDLESVLAIDPDYDYARGNLLHLRMQGGDWCDFARETALIDEGVRAGKRIVEPFVYQSISQSPADLQACSRIYADHRYPAAPALWKKPGRRHDKIRIGYVSGEFREHATPYLVAGLFERHDKDKFEIVAFDNGAGDSGPTRKRLEAAFDRFVDIARLPDKEAAEKILAEEIDILVNLNGYFGLPRMEAFAYKPAPIQVNYLGFPATLGATYIDYILADRFVIPEEERRYYTEQVVYLPDSYQANDSKRVIAPTAPSRAASGLPDGAFVFCNFNQSYKLTPETFAAWMRILAKAEGSVLWLLEAGAAFSENLRRAAAHHGVAGERLIFAPRLPVGEHLARLALADLSLDSLPCNCHTTASDALWAGLPLVTHRGKAFAGRVAASLLHAIGLPELVTQDGDAYEALALKLASDPVLLQSLRQKLAHNRSTAPLFDTDRFRRHIESAYTTMWEKHQRGQPAKGFSVPTDA